MENNECGRSINRDLDDLQEIISRPGNSNHMEQHTNETGHLSISPIFDTGVQANVEILDLKELYDKYQKKTLFGSEQRIACGKVNFCASASAQIVDIRVFVQRCPEAAKKCNEKIGPVPLNVTFANSTDVYRTCFSIDLDSVYKTENDELVYDLHKVEVEERNIWNLMISLEFIDGTMKHFESNSFRIRTKPRTKKPTDSGTSTALSYDQPIGGKRLRLDSEEREPLLGKSNNHVINFEQPSPGTDSGASSNYGTGTSGSSSTNTNEVLTDYLEAQRANIEILKVTNMVCTPKADIAYHLKLKRAYNKNAYMEGDIVGFFQGENGETEIEKLTNDNVSEARMAGVISRSAYLYGNLPEAGGEETDSVCVIGIVKVKVMGPIKNGEKIYASFGEPGLAIPESSLSLISNMGRSPTLLGQALEKSQTRNLKDITLVKCFVSIVLGIQSQHVAAAVGEVRESLDKKIKEQLKQARKKSRRVWIFNGTIIFIILVLVGSLLYEVFCPGSAFRYWQCRRGSIPGHRLEFEYVTTDFQIPKVNGIEFYWEKLKDKLNLAFDQMSGKGNHYYLNIDRCAYGGTVTVSSWLDHYKQVRGAEIFAVNSTCTGVFFEFDKKWKVYTSARDIECIPPYTE